MAHKIITVFLGVVLFSFYFFITATMADQTTRVVDLIRRNESAFTFSLSNNASVLESLIDSFYQKKLIVTEKTADNDTTSERASLLMKNIVTVLDSDPSIVIKVFNEHKILKELLSILEIKNKGLINNYTIIKY